jgi:hypothetical protein
MRRVLLLIAATALVVSAAATARSVESEAIQANCDRTSVGFDALPDLGAGTYRGYQGGLYPGGLNVPPDAYRAQGLAAAGRVHPIDGKIVLLSIGMSNTTQEYSRFKLHADLEPTRNPALDVVDGAQGGQDAEAIRNPNAPYWTVVDQRLAAAQVTRKQVRAVWLKQAIAGENRAFPADALGLQDALQAIVDILHHRFPNLELVYLSSRTYAGYASTSLNPEPYAYESSFAVKWTIQARIEGPETRPWLGWGPYLWTDGLRGRSDGLVWWCSDTQSDGTHPSESGRGKVAKLLLHFFTRDETARPWFVRPEAKIGFTGP